VTRAPRVILASRSAVRRRLLVDAGFVVDVVVSGVDETARPNEDRASLARRLARDKARAVAERAPGALVIGADQTGFLDDGTALDTCSDADAARAQLVRMSGTTHSFVSAAALVKDDVVLAEIEGRARVTFRALSDDDLARALDSDEWRGSCGGYRLEGVARDFVVALDGEEAVVLGLPMSGLAAALIAHRARRAAPAT
jgi:septum formation protein